MTITGAGHRPARSSNGVGRAAERATARAQQGGGRRHPVDREAVRPRLDHEARLGRAAGGRRHPHRLDRAGPGARRRRHAARPDHGDLRPRVVRQDDALPARPRRGAAARRRRRVHRRRARAGPAATPARAASTWTSCSSASRTPASRRWRSPRRSSARAASTASWSTPSRRSCRAPRSRARWATRSWASRRG